MANDTTQKLLTPVTRNSAGGVVIDSRGRNVWQWKDEQLDSTSVVLKRLENDALQLEPTRRVQTLKEASESKAKAKATAQRGASGLDVSEKLDYDPGRGFDPYNRS
jgi:type II secretory pathway component PulC